MVKINAASVGFATCLVAVGSSAAVVEKREPAAAPSADSVAKRQQQITTGAFSAFTGTLPASVSSVIATITSGSAASVSEPTAKSTYAAGATNTFIANAPPLPGPSANPASFPALDKIPDANLPLSQEFLRSVDFSTIPNIPATDGTCTGQAAANAAANHWWTCGGHTVQSDVTVCPDKNTWGLSYDDGPSPYTPQLLDYLDQKNLKSTFFIVGSRAISRPALLRYEYMSGHQLSVHTWSHPALTTLTNEEIVLELAWTKYVIQQLTGVTPLTMRPPYGDIDDRVRAICRQLNLTPVIWTSDGSSNYDTNDWRIGAGQVSAASVVGNFTEILDRAPSLDTGYIVLAHDLYQQSVELATGVVLPMALAHQPQQKLEPIVQCLNLEAGDAYVETNRNVSGSGGVGSPGDSNPSSNSSSSTGSTGGSGSTGNLGGNSGSSGSSGSGGSSGALGFADRVPAFAATTLAMSVAVLAFTVL